MTNPNLIFYNDHFTIEQSSESPIPGYLILRTTHLTDSISSMHKEALSLLGPIIALSYSCLESIIAPEVIYCARFGEKVRAIHFHIFPRSKYIGDEYRNAYQLSETADISAPQLLAWIMNNKIKFAISKQLIPTIRLLQDKFQEIKNSYL